MHRAVAHDLCSLAHGFPWVLGLAAASAVAINAVIIGVLIICYALWAMRIDIAFGDGEAYGANQRRPA